MSNVGVSDADINREPTLRSQIELAVLKVVYWFFAGLLVSLICIAAALAVVVTLTIVLSPIWVTVWMLA